MLRSIVLLNEKEKKIIHLERIKALDNIGVDVSTLLVLQFIKGVCNYSELEISKMIKIRDNLSKLVSTEMILDVVVCHL